MQGFGVRQAIKTHEQEVQSGIVACLGNQLDCLEHRSSPTDVRFWRLKRALEYALSLRRLPGRIWEVILGHCTFLCLQERGSLSTFFTIYSFILKNYYTSEPLWNSARQELLFFFGLMYFLQSSWRLPGVGLLVLLMPTPLGMLCVLGSDLNKRLPETASSGILVPLPVTLCFKPTIL